MSGLKPSARVVWHDLTVEDAAGVRDFYASVLGVRHEPVDMGGYADFNLIDRASGDVIAGVCHARSTNEGLPPQWMVYFAVDDLDAAMSAVRSQGGEVLDGPRSMPGHRYAFVRDPAGAVCALTESEHGGGDAAD